LTLSEWKVPLFDLDVGNEELRGVTRVLDSKWLCMGKVTERFESAFADYLGVKHALAVSSGTAAMHLAHHALGVARGHEVICPSLTFVATANAVGYTGAMPVFADISSLGDLTISPDDIESRIHENTKGIMVVHYAGFPCDMDRIMQIARRHDLFVIEDAAHAVGATYSSKQKGLKAEEAESSKLKAQSKRSSKLNQSSKLSNGQRTCPQSGYHRRHRLLQLLFEQEYDHGRRGHGGYES
jgi:dTDP-4-amino-4,6-dideoxygalactose transaminase